MFLLERSQEWTQKMDIERFRWHNAQWLEIVAENNDLATSDSLVSGTPHVFDEVFVTENIFGVAPNSFAAHINCDF